MSYVSELETKKELEEEYWFSLPWREAEFETPAGRQHNCGRDSTGSART
jgi:hypothetical protein